MIYGKIWCVVKPSVGLPLFFIGVALTALSVHLAILTKTDWYPKYLNGKVAAAPMAAPADAAPAAKK